MWSARLHGPNCQRAFRVAMSISNSRVERPLNSVEVTRMQVFDPAHPKDEGYSFLKIVHPCIGGETEAVSSI